MAMHTAGASLYYSDDNVTYTELTDVRLVTPPNLTRGDVDVTVLASPNAIKEYIPGWRELGELPFELLFTDDIFTDILALYNDNDAYYWKIIFPLVGAEVTGAQIITVGYLKAVGISELNTEDNGVMIPCSIKLTPNAAGSVYFTYTEAS
jgi:hypothetical protein